MSLLIKHIRLVDPRSDWNGRYADVLVDKGVIIKIAEQINTEAQQVIDFPGAWLAPAMVDLRAFIREPGMEHQETIASGLKAAAAGGFSRILAHPSKGSALNTAADVTFLRSKSSGFPVHLYPCAAISHDLNSQDLNELSDMYLAGAVAYSNGNRPFRDYGLLMRALQYTSRNKALFMTHAIDPQIEHGGMVNESETTIHTGLKQSPALSEYAEVSKQIEIAKYCERAIHFSHISCKESVEAIRLAKSKGFPVTCDVSIMHLCFNDEQILSYNSHFKLNPPLRGEIDRQALVQGILDGTIDAIVSDHQPLNIELKKVEFDYASFGAINLQTMFSLYIQYLEKDISPEIWFDRCSIRPSRLLMEEVPEVKEGNESEFAIFSPDAFWSYNQDTNVSKSFNHPLLPSALKGLCRMLVTPRGNYQNTLL